MIITSNSHTQIIQCRDNAFFYHKESDFEQLNIES